MCEYQDEEGNPCHFTRWHENQFDYHGNQFCIFHLPLEAKKQWDDHARGDFNHAYSVEFGANQGDFSNCYFIDGDYRVSHHAQSFANSQFGNQTTFAVQGHGKLDFSGCEFLGQVGFTNQPLGQRGVSFEGAKFRGPALFQALSEHERARHAYELNFKRAKFFDEADFRNRKFNGPISFEKAKFHKTPNFIGSEFPEEFNFDDADFDKIKITYADYEKYRYIRKQAGDKRARHTEGGFFVHEQRCLRRKYPRYHYLRIISALYDWTSRYGTRFMWAFGNIVLVQIIAFALYRVVLIWHTGHGTDYVGKTIFFTLSQAFRPFEIYSLRLDLEPLWPIVTERSFCWVAAIATLQGIATLSLLALFLLALRWRFKRD